ncbi:hypothetical protein MMC20_005455 [Loxospora ochrophaea]|nr:hypothetical protein [Loxospora ochrophaea]
MHSFSFSALFLTLLSTIVLALAQSTTPAFNLATVTSLTPQQSSKIESDFLTYFSVLVTQPAFSSFASVFQTAVPNQEIPTAYATGAAINGTTINWPSFVSDLPPNAQSYFKSIVAAELSIVSKDVNNQAPRPTGVLVAAGAMVAGVVGVAAVL